jgi:hypothetical protein
MTNILHCSFCQKPEGETGPLLATMDTKVKRLAVRICRSCAEMAIDTIDQEVLRRDADKPRPNPCSAY